MMLKTLYSPNFSRKIRNNKDIKLIVLHYTGMQSKIESVRRLISKNHKVSCHYLIDRRGQIFQMVEDKRVAWHAGKSKWKNFKNLNENSIGIELVNKGHEYGYESFSKPQINELIKLCSNLKQKYKILNSNIVGHSDIAPLRKRDPGEKFPWKKLQKKKLGIWYEIEKKKNLNLNKKNLTNLFFKNLHKIGYRYFNLSKRRRSDKYLVKAFQRRFLQTKITGQIDYKTYIISHFLANNT
ncbi:MAG: hypothetical protein CMJ01_04000 [Pelagibacteraceae bacterium]|nr:hypothetical protein [Pelagibacteraceae bacterium]